MEQEQKQQKIRPRIRLVRYFTIVSIIGVVIATAVMGLIFHRNAIDNLVRVGENRNIALAGILVNSIWSKHRQHFERTKELAAEEARSLPSLRTVQLDVFSKIRNTSIIKVKFYDRNGKTLFSTETQQIGSIKTNSDNIRQALENSVVTDLTFRDEFYAADAVLKNRNVLASYVPILKRPGEAGPAIVGLIEVYSDITDLYEQLIDNRNDIIVSVLITLLGLFAVLLLFMRRVERTIKRQLEHRRRDAERMRHIAYHDGLTGLPNREMYHYRLRVAIEQAKRSERLVAVLFLDLDRFKNINDNLGHTAGDELLKQVSVRLIQCVRQVDTIARQGGDEFTILLEGINHVDEVVQVCDRIIESINKPFTINGAELFVSTSIGITVFPFDDVEPEGLMKDADAAMYAAKEAGRNKYMFYSSGMRRQEGSEQIEMENRLRQALQEDEYLLHYQPIVDVRSGAMMGVEALLRWDNSEYGIVSPIKFIPLLEESGLMGIVGQWVLNTACAKAKEWQQAGYPPVIMSVNVSMVQFRQMNFVETVQNALRLSELDPKYLRLELTESMLMEQNDVSVQKLEAIRNMGVIIEIDDFGTGYSSLSYLKKLPVDVLKIDRSFITDIHKRGDSAAIVTAIMGMAHSLKMEIIAEGVEELEELKYLSALNCKWIQGYFYSKPLLESDLIKIMQDPDYFINKLADAREREFASSNG